MLEDGKLEKERIKNMKRTFSLLMESTTAESEALSIRKTH